MQKSLGVYHDFACQAIASTTKNSEINATFVWGARQGQTRKQDKRQTRPKKTKKNKKKPLFLEKTSRFGSDDAHEMPTELHKPNNNKAVMRVLLTPRMRKMVSKMIKFVFGLLSIKKA